MKTHEKHLIATHDDKHGQLSRVIPAPLNNSVMLICGDPDVEDEMSIQRCVFNGKVIAETDWLCLSAFAISYDGKKAVTAVFDQNTHKICVNGELLYDVPFSTVHYLSWLDSDKLVWFAWNDHHERRRDPIGTFRNNEDVTDNFNFTLYGNSQGLGGLVAVDYVRGAVWDIDEFGQTVQEKKLPPNMTSADHVDLLDCFDFYKQGERPEHIETGKEVSYRVRIKFQGKTGPEFHGIEKWKLNPDDSTQIMYIGVRGSKLAMKCENIAGRALNHLEGDSKLKEIFIGWPLAILWNPYFGPGRIWVEASKRYFPATEKGVWEKGYGHIYDSVFTPQGELVVHVYDRRSQRVVVDEDEGPKFDSIDHLRRLPNGEVSYIAQEGNEFYRVVIK